MKLRLCSSSCCRAIPVIFVLALMVWSYYCYVAQICIHHMSEEHIRRPIYIAVYNLLFTFMIWSFFACMCTHVSKVPPPYKLSAGMIETIRHARNERDLHEILASYCQMNQIRLWTRTDAGYIRYCPKCKNIKPDRTHHCSTCKVCILKMDHHCPWMNTCISFSNYKLFILSVFYTTLYCLYYVATATEWFYNFVMDSHKNYQDLNFIIAIIICFIAAVILFILLMYHMRLICKNQTMIERIMDTTYIYKENLSFNVGFCYNWKEVFGENLFLWGIPVQTSVGNGTEFFTAFA